mgnify:CR=1 FL=1
MPSCASANPTHAKTGAHTAWLPPLLRPPPLVQGTEETPQLQKETSQQGASTTAGGAYASRDDPKSQAAQPTAGKSQKQIVEVGGGGAGQPQLACTCHAWSKSGHAHGCHQRPRCLCPPSSALPPVQEQGAGAFVHPEESGNAEGGEPMAPAHSPGYAGRWWEGGRKERACLLACLPATVAAL